MPLPFTFVALIELKYCIQTLPLHLLFFAQENQYDLGP